jgi:hypothetical protein
MGQQKKDLIVGVIANCRFGEVVNFVRSLAATGCPAECLLFHNGIDKDALERLASLNVTLIPFKNEFPFLDGPLPPPAREVDLPLSFYCSRYLIYDRYLQMHRHEYNKVFVTDVRDVFFQDDPFKRIEGGVHCFLEDAGTRLAYEPYNSKWMATIAGELGLFELRNKIICCSGTTMGAIDDILQYLKEMVTVLMRVTQGVGIDQAAHNYVVHTGLLKNVTLEGNEEGAVLSMHLRSRDKTKLDGEGRVLNDSGTVPAIVHQYDRHPDLCALINKRYGGDVAANPNNPPQLLYGPK